MSALAILDTVIHDAYMSRVPHLLGDLAALWAAHGVGLCPLAGWLVPPPGLLLVRVGRRVR